MQRRYILITGGAGFIGTNVARSYLAEGQPVHILDNLARPGVSANVSELQRQYPARVAVHAGGRSEPDRHRESRGRCEGDLPLRCSGCRYDEPRESYWRTLTRTCSGRSGCWRRFAGLMRTVRCFLPRPTKCTGNYRAFDSRRTDRAGSRKTAGWRIMVRVRTSRSSFCRLTAVQRKCRPICPRLCSFLPDSGHRFPDELHLRPVPVGVGRSGLGRSFVRQAMKGEPITIYGDGKQVRDLLFVEDLVRAMRTAHGQHWRPVR